LAGVTDPGHPTCLPGYPSCQVGPFHLGHRLVNHLCHRHLPFLPDLRWFMCIRAILVGTFAKEVEVAAIPLSSYLDRPKPDPTFFDHVHD
jgi:hypothetical protein